MLKLLVELQKLTNGDAVAQCELKVTLDNSFYQTVATVDVGNLGTSGIQLQGSQQYIFDVTNTTNNKFLLRTGSMASGTFVRGSTTVTETGFTVIRLGDT